jgi:ferric-chelate reductase [NAD(P)H]
MGTDLNRKFFNDITYGLYIVTSINDGHLNGQIINTAIQVTSEPPRLAVIINKKNLTHEYITKSKVFAVSILDESAPFTFFGPFGFRSGRDFNKFAKVQYKKGITGCPLITEYILSSLEAKVIDMLDVGTHTIFVGDAINSEVIKEGKPLTYKYYRETLKGKASVNSPEYNSTNK